MAEKLSETQLEAIIAQQIELAKSHDRSERATARDKALDYYFGKMDKYVPPEPNRSKVVSRDVADTIGWLMPEIMRVFTAAGSMFLAEPAEAEDLQYSQSATDGLNHVFWKDNFGYGIVYDGTWNALLHGDGIIKTFYEDEPVYGPARFHEDLTEDQRALLLDDKNVDVLAHTEKPGAGGAPSLYDVKLRRKKADGRFVITAIPSEDFLIDGDAVSLEEAAFKDHWQRKTRSSLVAMGYDKDVIWTIPEAARNETPEAQARRPFVNADATDMSMQLVDYHECFIMVDADGDGVAEMVRACYGGGKNGKLLDWEVWEDEDPFDNVRCEPIPHRWDSRSVADEEIDVQDVKTVLSRQLLNNVYWVNNPQRFAQGKITNPEALDAPTFGQTVFGAPGSTVTDLPVPFIGDKALLAINYMDEVSARRTGVNSQSMALDPEVLQNQSATANQNATNASRSQPELIARNMAEYGWKKIGRKLLRLMAKRQTAPRTILVKGKAVTIEPGAWNPDMHVEVNVGLGTGARDRDTMVLGQVLQQQIAYTDRIGTVFPDKALDMLPKIHNTLTGFIQSTGIKNPELYWPEIDPKDIEAGKAKLAQTASQPPLPILIEQMKGQQAKELAQAKAQSDQAVQASEAQSNQMKAQAETMKSQAEAQVKGLEAQLNAQKQQFEAMMAQEELRIRQLESDAKNATELRKAAWANLTSLEIARIGASKDTAPEPGPVESELENIVGIAHGQNATAAKLDMLHQAVTAMHQSINAPVVIDRGPDGKAVGARKVING